MQRRWHWHNQNARHSDVMTAQLRERARIRSEKAICPGRPPSQPCRPCGLTAVL